MSSAPIFVIVPQREKERFEKYIRNVAALSAADAFKVIGVPSQNADQEELDRRFHEVCETIATYKKAGAFSDLILHREVKCSNRSSIARECGGKSTSISNERTLKKTLEDRGAHWKVHASREVEKWEYSRLNLETWLQQFHRLGIIDIAQGLLKQIEVFSPSQTNTAFQLTAAESAGLKIQYCYVDDGEPGGSYNEVKKALEHLHSASKVTAVKWDKSAQTLTLPVVDADQLVLCEDGLWSGVETRDRLIALSKIKSESRAIKLRFAVISDFGLRIVRHAIRNLGLNNVEVDVLERCYFRQYLTKNLPTALEHGRRFRDEGVFRPAS
jgi:hypothetical protein